LQLDCKTKKLHTPGKTVNISSTGVLFNAQNELTLGPGIDLVLDWPVLLEGYTALRLHLRGSIVRASGRQAAFEIVKYKFQTTKRPPTPESWSVKSFERLPLTARERETVLLVTEGYKNHEMAEKMGISEQTTKNHLHSIFEKLGVADRLELALYAIHESLRD
jgi:DNA-binding CsgD family transcriptional regulator